MHFISLVFHIDAAETVMKKFYTEATKEDGADIVFMEMYTVAKAKAEYKGLSAEEKEKYSNVNEYMENCFSYELQGKKYGYFVNNDGITDGYQIGGRFKNMLPNFSDEKELKKIVSKELNLKRKVVKNRYRDNVNEYVKIKSMSLMDAVRQLGVGGTDSIEISKELSAEAILDFFIGIYENDPAFEGEKFTRERAYNQVMDSGYLVLEEEGEETEIIYESDMQTFIETYNRYIELNEEKETPGKYYLTVLDCHI